MVFAKEPRTKQEIMKEFNLDETRFNQIHEQLITFETLHLQGETYCFGLSGEHSKSIGLADN